MTRFFEGDHVKTKEPSDFPYMVVKHVSHGRGLVTVNIPYLGKQTEQTCLFIADQLELVTPRKKKGKVTAPHPMGEPVPNQYFVWVEQIYDMSYHPIVVRAESDADAVAIATEEAENFTLQAATHRQRKIIAHAAPVRTGHLIDRSRDDIPKVIDVGADQT